jgi:hypothetical protein
MKNIKDVKSFIFENTEEQDDKEYGPFVAIFSEENREIIAILPAWNEEWIESTYNDSIESEKEDWAERYCEQWYEDNRWAYRPATFDSPEEWDECEPDESDFETTIEISEPFMEIPDIIKPYVTPRVTRELEKYGYFEL